MSTLNLSQSINFNLLPSDRLSAITDYYIRKFLQQHIAQLTAISQDAISSDAISLSSTDLCSNSIALFDRLRTTHEHLAPIVQILKKLVL